jgi:hypothetical protein
MNIYTNPNYKHCKTITFKPESIDDGIKIGLLKAKLKNHKIHHKLNMNESKIESITITDFDLIKLIIGMDL